MKKVITISRECGSGGHSIAIELSKKLGIPVYDKNDLVRIANQMKNESNNKRDGLIERSLYNSTSIEHPIVFPYSMFDKHQAINEYQASIIKDLANNPCIIIGRGSNYILRDREDTLNVFIYAPLEYKVTESAKKHNLDIKKAKSILKERDKKRAKNYYYYTNRDWKDLSSYHLLIDSSIGVDLVVDIICKAYNE